MRKRRPRSRRIATKATKAGCAFPAPRAPRHGSVSVHLRLSRVAPAAPFKDFNRMVDERIAEADESDLQRDIEPGPGCPSLCSARLRRMIRKQAVLRFRHPAMDQRRSRGKSLLRRRWRGRNRDWMHLKQRRHSSRECRYKWEYPWYAAWDLAFHTLALLADRSNQQLRQGATGTVTRESGHAPETGRCRRTGVGFLMTATAVPAPAHRLSSKMDRKQHGGKGRFGLSRARVSQADAELHLGGLIRKDAERDATIFQGGFLGSGQYCALIRSAQLPTGGHIDQADGTSWMAMYSLNLMRIALELAQHNPVYEDVATKFFEHFLHIAEAMNNVGEAGIRALGRGGPILLRRAASARRRHGTAQSALDGRIPFRCSPSKPSNRNCSTGFPSSNADWKRSLLKYRPDLASLVSHWNVEGRGHRRLLSLLRGHRMKRLLKRMLDETEFLSDYGIRAISKHHHRQPYVFKVNGMDLSVHYLPAESDSGLFGGNSNWRGPIWFPVNYLLIESLQKFHHYYGDDFKIECPTGSGKFVSIDDAAREIAARLTRIFLKDEHGKRPVFSQYPRLQNDEHFRDHVLFYEYFHGDTGRGVGAAHQTGWTGLVAKLLQPRRRSRN